MCNFFSFRTDGAGKPYYLNAEQRKEMLAKGELPDSHTTIAHYYGFQGADEDMLNAYEYNPLTKAFEVDRMNNKDDSKAAMKWVATLDFKTIVPELIIKPIIHPFILPKAEATESDLELLKQWASVGASVRDSVRDSVGASSVRDSVGASIWDSVGASVRDSVGASVRDSVGASVWDSVGASSIWDSVGASVWAYTGSFFNLDKWLYVDHAAGVYPFQPCVDLWERGIVPSYDGKVWRLHSGENADVIWEGTL